MPLAFNTIFAVPDNPNPFPPFGQRPPSASISQGSPSNITITNKFFNQPVIGTDYIDLETCSNITITDCDFDTFPDAIGSGRRCIYLLSCTGTVSILRCRARSIPHNFIQFDKSHMTGTIANNRVRGTTTNSEDCISFFQSGGVDATNRLLVTNNAVDGNIPSLSTPGYTSSSGTGLICGDAAQDANTGFMDVVNNTFLNPGQVGLAIAGGNNDTVDGNIVYSIQTATSNVGMYIWNPGSSLVCSNMEARQNRVKWLNSSGSDNGFFNTGNCGTITNVSDNNFSDSTIDPANLTVNLG